MSSFTKQSINLKNFTWGISQDDFLTTWKQVLYTENLDLNRDSYFVSLGRANTWRFTTTASITWFFKSTDAVFAYTSDGKIYDSNWILKYTFSWNEPILQAWEFNNYIYFLLENTVSASYIHRVTDNSIILDTWIMNAVTITWDWFIREWNTFPIVVLLNENFVIWVWNSVYQITDDDISTEYNIWDWKVVWITRIGWVFKVYTENGVVAFWDWESNSIDSFIEINQTVRWVINDGKIDNIVAGASENQTELILLNWYTTQTLAQLRYSDRLWTNVFQIKANETQEFTKLGNVIYFKNDGESNTDNILSYGTLNPSLSDWFNIPFSIDSNWNVIDTLYSLFGHDSLNGDILYMWINSNSEFAVEKIALSWWTSFSYRQSWYLQTNIIDWWSRIQKKKIEAIKLITSGCDIDNTIELQQSIDWWTFSSIQTINTWAWITDTNIYTKKDTFRDIMFKINFVWDWNTTPKFYELQLIYTNIE
jgi:hypothetical protein